MIEQNHPATLIMATSNGDSSANKAFVIQHMNANHQDSLVLYLQAYCHVSARDSKSAQLEDISLSDLVISADGVRYSVPIIDPPMKSLSETRSRVVAMYQDSLQRLGFSDIPIKEYRAPRGHHLVIFTVCLATYIGFARRSNFLPGSILYESLGLEKVPSFTQFCYDIQPLLLPAMVGIHVLEAGLLAVVRLRRHRVPFLSGVWFAWMASTFIEGFGAFQRTSQMVKEERTKREHRK